MKAQQIENANINNNDKTIDELASDIQKIRIKICNAFLITFAIIAIPSLTASLYRVIAIGWQPVMAIHIMVAISLWGIVIFRNKVSYNIQASSIVIMFLIIGLGGIYQFGLVAGGIAFLVISSPIATLLFGGKIGIITLVIALSGSVVMGFLIVSGILQHEFDLPAYAIASSSWFNSIIGWALASTALTASLYVFNKKLIRALTISKQHQEALQLSKERLNMVLEGSEQGFWDWNIETGEVQRNDRWAEMLGYASINEFEDNTDSWTDNIHPDDRDTAWKAINDHLKGLSPAYKLEYRMLTKSGEVKWTLDQAKIVQRDAKGQPLRMCGTHTDITERKQAEHEKEILQRELQQSQKMEALGKLTGGIAHEYNNMLAIIMGFSELLKDSLIKQPKLLKYTNEIQHAGDRAAKLTSKLLTFSRQNIPKAENLNLNDLLQMLHHMLEKTLTVRINLVFNLQENLWQVWLDEGDMEDAILNMSINAMHAIEGNGQLTIQTSNQNVNQMDAQSLGIEPGDYVLLSFEDTGCGFDDEIKEKIFDPFFSTKGEKGTGLGLSMVYGFVHDSGGVIKVNSELGQGTQFTLYFPRYYGSSRAQQLTADNPVETFKENKSILVVDDESSLLDLTNEILSSHGFKVYCAESAKEAVNILQHETIDILLSDVIMPEMDGYQLAAIVKEKYPEIKIQLASGFSDDRNMGMVDEHLQNNLLHKPYSSQELLLRMRELCNGNNRSSISS